MKMKRWSFTYLLSLVAIFVCLSGFTANWRPSAWDVVDWYFDPANTSGNASDGNACVTSGAPCLSYAAVVSIRWGTRGPFLQKQLITFHVLSGQTATQAANDPLTLEPHTMALPIEGGTTNASLLYIVGTPTVITTTTISAIVAKNRTAGTRLKATLTAGNSKGKLYIDSTHPSNAWSVASSGGAEFMSQPVICNSGGAPTTGQVNCGEVNWTAGTNVGDTVTVNTLPAIGLGTLKPHTEYMGFTESGGIYLRNLDVFQFGGEDVGDTPLLIGDHVTFQDCSFEHNVALDGNAINNGGGGMTGIGNGYLLGSIQGGLSGSQFTGTGSAALLRGFLMFAGSLDGTTLAGSEAPAVHDMIFDGDFVLTGGNLSLSGNTFVGTFENEGTVYNQGGILDMQSGATSLGSQSIMWGTAGTLDSSRGTVYYTNGTATFTGSLALNIAGSTTGCVAIAAAAASPVCGKTVATGANLDTQIDAGSIGCVTIGPSGYCNTAF